MTQLIVIFLCLIAIITTFFKILWGWVIVSILSAFLLITLFSLKTKKWAYIKKLSPMANKMLQKFGHFYSMPFAGRDFSASASTLIFASIILAIIGAFKGFWWGFAIAVVNWLFMSFVSRAFNPSNFLVDDEERLAHDEIIEYIQQKQTERIKHS